MAGSRPPAAIDADIAKTRTAMCVCHSLARTALAERRELLAAGWAVQDALCKELDALALHWTTRAGEQRKALGELVNEAAGGREHTT